MSETDSFIREVEEEVRQDRMFRLWKKYGPYAVAAVIGFVAISAGLTWMKHREVQKARETGGAFLASDIGSVEDQQALVDSVDGPAETIARLRLAAAKAVAGQAEDAAKLYREVAGQPGLDPIYAELARLEAVRVSAAMMDPADAVAELEQLTAQGAPYRLLALELRAAIRLNAGETEAAHADLKAIMADPQATRDIQERATVMLVSSGGDATAAAQ